VWPLVHYLLLFAIVILVARLVLDYVMAFTRYRPSGAVAVLFEFVYTVTDPPLKALRRVIPPLRVGNAAIDISFMVLVLGLSILNSSLPR
jgi:YggT family protein